MSSLQSPNIPNKDTYITPEITRDVEAVFESPEIHREAAEFYDANITSIELALDSLHSRASVANLPKLATIEAIRREVTKIFVVNGAERTLEDELVEAESQISRKVLPKTNGVVDHRFWAHKDKATNQTDWFYEVRDAVGLMTARYNFAHPTPMKLVDGRPVAFYKDPTRGIDEEANIKEMIPKVFNQVYIDMYANLSIDPLIISPQPEHKQDHDLAA